MSLSTNWDEGRYGRGKRWWKQQGGISAVGQKKIAIQWSLHIRDNYNTHIHSTLMPLVLPVLFSDLSLQQEHSLNRETLLYSTESESVFVLFMSVFFLHAVLFFACLSLCPHSSLLQSYMKWLQTDPSSAVLSLYMLSVCSDLFVFLYVTFTFTSVHFRSIQFCSS